MTSKNDTTTPTTPTLDEFLKSTGAPSNLTGGSGKSAPAPDSASAGSTTDLSPKSEPGHVPSYNELDWQQKMGQGVAKNLAGLATGVPKLANWGLSFISPELSAKAGEAAESVPGVKRMEDFAASKSEGGFESLGNFMTSATLGAIAGRALPGSGAWGEKAADAVAARGATQLPGQFTRGGITAAADTYAPQVLARGEGVARTLGEIAEAATKGGITGAISDPEHPFVGGTLGAVTGGALEKVPAALRSEMGQWVAGHGLRGSALLATETLAHSLGIPTSALWATGIAEALIFWRSPAAKVLHAGGEKAALLMARAIAASNPTIPAAGVGKIAEALQSFGRGGRHASGAHSQDALREEEQTQKKASANEPGILSKLNPFGGGGPKGPHSKAALEEYQREQQGQP